MSTTPLVDTLQRIMPSAAVVVEKKHERLGPVAHTLLAERLLGDDEPIIVCYCDFFMDWDYAGFQRTVAANGCDGAVVAYMGFHPHLLGAGLYGSLLVDDQRFMTHYKEKHSWTPNKMDCYQSAGAYYFKHGRYVKAYFREVLECEESVLGEHYVSQAYPRMVRDGLRVYVHEVQHFCQWGAPADLEEYAFWSDVFRKMAKEPRTFHYWKSFFHKMPWHPYTDDHHPPQD